MTKETLEEAAERLVPEAGCELNNSEASYWQQGWIIGHIDGAKWQQERMYSEEEMLNFAWFLLRNVGQYSDDRIAHFEGKYLEQFKNK